MAFDAVFRVKELRDIILAHAAPYDAARWRRVCRAWHGSAALGPELCEDVIREVAFLLDRCYLQPFFFERVQAVEVDWRCTVCDAVVDGDSCASCDPHGRRLLVPAGLPVAERASFVDWVRDRGEWRSLKNEDYYAGAWRQHPFPPSHQWEVQRG